jgi:hypothetical protein
MNYFKTLMLLLTLTSVSCVTIQFDQQKVSRSNQYEYQIPQSFTERESDNQTVDKEWFQANTGSVISLYSECQPRFEPSLEKLQADILLSINDKKQIFKNTYMYNNRKALRSLYLTKVDGIETNVELISLKKNDCFYIISFTSSPNFYNKDLILFNQYLTGLKIK